MFIHHFCIPLVLLTRVHQPIAHSQTLKIDLNSLLAPCSTLLQIMVIHEDHVINGGGVVPPIALPHNI